MVVVLAAVAISVALAVPAVALDTERPYFATASLAQRQPPARSPTPSPVYVCWKGGRVRRAPNTHVMGIRHWGAAIPWA